MQSLDFDQGIQTVIKGILDSKEKPFVVSVTGFSNSGKTTFCKTVHNQLHEVHGIRGWYGQMGADRFALGRWKVPEYFLVEDQPPASRQLTKYTQQLLGKDPDMMVYIIPALVEHSHGLLEHDSAELYDVVIENVGAVSK